MTVAPELPAVRVGHRIVRVIRSDVEHVLHPVAGVAFRWAVTTEMEVDREPRQRPLDSVDPPAREASRGPVQRSPAGIRTVPYSTYILRCCVSAGDSVEIVPRVGFEPSTC